MTDDDLPCPSTVDTEINRRNKELGQREQLRDIVMAHVDELSDDHIRVIGAWLSAMARGRKLKALDDDASDRDLRDAIAYMFLELEARRHAPLSIELTPYELIARITGKRG